MNLNVIKERVAAGLKNMSCTPSALLFCGNSYTAPTEIAGMKIYVSTYIENTYSDNNVPFIPIWDDPSSDCQLWIERKLFESGFLGEC